MTMKMENTTTGDGFHNISTNWRSSREFRFSHLLPLRYLMKGQIQESTPWYQQ